MTDLPSQGESAAFIDPDARLQRIRAAFVDDSLRGLLWLSLCILCISFWRNFLGPEALRWRGAFAVVLCANVLMLATFLWRKSLSYHFKAVTLLCTLFLAGTGGLISFGQVAPTGIYFAMGFFISAVLFSRSVVFSMIGGAVAIMALVAYSTISGLNQITVNLNAVAHQPAAWINMVLTTALSAGAIASAVGSFTRAMHRLLGDVHRQQIQIREQHDQIHHLATHDNLTGLPIMRLAIDRSNVAIAHARRTGQKIAFMFIDLDGFKAVNDRFGHDAGDAVLKEVALRLASSIRGADTAARIGGDEFVIILPDLAQAHFAGDIAEKIIRTISAPIPYDDHALQVGASIGIALYPDHAGDLDELKKCADKAMYAVKVSGKNHYQFAPDRPTEPAELIDTPARVA